MKHLASAIIGTATLAATADAGFLGFVAFKWQSGTNVLIDVFTAVQNSSDKLLNVYNANISTTVSGGFVQAGGLAGKTWKPDAAGFTSTRNSIDSFLTIGCYSGAAYGGEYYASANTNGDPNFTGTSWNATPASAPANTIPPNAGWYTGDPTSVDNHAMNLQFVGKSRVDSAGSVGAQYGVWCAHLCLANITVPQVIFGLPGDSSANVFWDAYASVKDGANGSTSQGHSILPAPGAVALLGIAGFASRRRRG